MGRLSAYNWRLATAPGFGDQEVERFNIATDPVSQRLTEGLDPFGNRAFNLRIEKPHRQLSIVASSRVRVVPAPTPIGSPSWQSVAAEAIAIKSLDADCPAVALYPSRCVALFDEATAYAKRASHRTVQSLTLRLSWRNVFGLTSSTTRRRQRSPRRQPKPSIVDGAFARILLIS